MRSRPVHLLRLRSVPVRPMVFARPALQMALFSTSNSRLQDAPQSPFRVFVNVLKEELQKNKDLQENVKTLQGDVDKFSDSEAMKRTREMYEKARVSCG
jgi:import inner membrane translocase subunit TIM44